jgi:hypothetical protein
MGSNPSSRVTAIGLAVILLGVSAGVGSGELGLLLGLLGILFGANTIFAAGAGVLKGGEAPTTPARLGVLAAFSLHNLAVVGMILSSAAAILSFESRPTVVSPESLPFESRPRICLESEQLRFVLLDFTGDDVAEDGRQPEQPSDGHRPGRHGAWGQRRRRLRRARPTPWTRGSPRRRQHHRRRRPKGCRGPDDAHLPRRARRFGCLDGVPAPQPRFGINAVFHRRDGGLRR